MYSIIYQTGNGVFVALSENHIDPLPSGLSAKSVGELQPDMSAYQWDPSTFGLVPRTPQRIVSKLTFIQRFTDAERRALFGFSLDSSKTETQRKLVFAFERYLDFLDMINLDDTSVASGMLYLETVGVLTSGRSGQILS